MQHLCFFLVRPACRLCLRCVCTRFDWSYRSSWNVDLVFASFVYYGSTGNIRLISASFVSTVYANEYSICAALIYDCCPTDVGLILAVAILKNSPEDISSIPAIFSEPDYSLNIFIVRIIYQPMIQHLSFVFRKV